ncbi:hypothetical protein Bca4012_091296 [Brassica carinata]|uniref:Acyl-CoA dehydrogenase/oxidase C-terminal domain-containing protein n=1 Tax=Brassica carinata TaxID=52824 RepID=A0A8X7TKZ8_BRACI|nr:hypothetical protein Bca52824_085390 [Brassica carinata]
MALKVLDTAVQVHGAACLSSDTVLAHLWATTARTLRIADGADEVHLGTIGKLELQRALTLFSQKKESDVLYSTCIKISLRLCLLLKPQYSKPK